MTDTQKHHYVPQFLLKRWCDNNGKLTVYSRRNERVVISKLTPEYTAFERKLYTLEQIPSEKRHVIENYFMSPLDTQAALIVQKILNGGFTSLNVDERSNFTRFILSLRARHPNAVALAKERGREAVMAALSRDPEEYAAVKGESSAATLVEWTNENAPTLIPNFGVSRLPELITDERACKPLFRAAWLMRDVSAANTDLLLSDRPCLLGGDVVCGEFVIVLPISPTMLFFACNLERETQLSNF